MFFFVLGEHITIAKLNAEIKKKEIMDLGKTSLRTVLMNLGFKYRREDNRRFLVEASNISSMRAVFFRQYMQNKNALYPGNWFFWMKRGFFQRGHN